MNLGSPAQPAARKAQLIMLQRGLFMCCRELGQRYTSDTAVPSSLQNFGYAGQLPSQCLPWQITSHTHQCPNYCLTNGLSSPHFPITENLDQTTRQIAPSLRNPALPIFIYSTRLALTALIQSITPE